MREPYINLFFWDFNHNWKELVGELPEGIMFTPAKLTGRSVEFGPTWPVSHLASVRGAYATGAFLPVAQSRLPELLDRLGLEIENNRLAEGSLLGNTLMNVDLRVVQTIHIHPDHRTPDHRFLANLFLYGAFVTFAYAWQEFLVKVFDLSTLAEANRLLVSLDTDAELSVRPAVPGDLLFPSHSDAQPDLREPLRVSLIGATEVVRTEYRTHASVTDLLENLDSGAFGLKPQILLLQPDQTGFTFPIQIDEDGWRLIRSGQIPFPKN